MVFPGVAASWAPQLEFFTSKGSLAETKPVSSIGLMLASAKSVAKNI